MRIACIYFKRPNYHPLAMEAEVYRQIFRAAGHTFDVLLTDSVVGSAHEKDFDLPDHITVPTDGLISHHSRQVWKSCQWLEDNYDALLFLGACPKNVHSLQSVHNLYLGCTLPTVVINCDNVVKQWEPEHVFPRHVLKTFYSHEHLKTQGASYLSIPFVVFGDRPRPMPAPDPHTTWMGHWSSHSNVALFLEQVPALAEHSRVSLQQTGPYYWKARRLPTWSRAINHDYGSDDDGSTSLGGSANYFATDISHATMALSLSGVWTVVDLTGLVQRKSRKDRAPEYTYATLYALYWGIWPVVAAHDDWPIPTEFIKQVYKLDASDLPDLIASIETPLAHTKHADAARKWVLDTHNGARNMATLLDAWGF